MINGELLKWEACAPPPILPTSGSFISQYDYKKPLAFYLATSTDAFMYDPSEDGWIALPSPGFVSGTFGLGNCGTIMAGFGSITKTAISGTQNSIYTDLNIKRDLSGFDVEVMNGPNGYQIQTIKNNTIGPSSVLTFTESGINNYTGSQYVLRTPFWWCQLGGIQTSGTTKIYDYASNEWSTHVFSPYPSGMQDSVSCATMVSSSPWRGDSRTILVSGIATSGDNNIVYISSVSGAIFNNYPSYPLDYNKIYLLNNSGVYQEAIVIQAFTNRYILNASGIDINNTNYIVTSNDNLLYLGFPNFFHQFDFKQNIILHNNTYSPVRPNINSVFLSTNMLYYAYDISQNELCSMNGIHTVTVDNLGSIFHWRPRATSRRLLPFSNSAIIGAVISLCCDKKHIYFYSLNDKYLYTYIYKIDTHDIFPIDFAGFTPIYRCCFAFTAYNIPYFYVITNNGRLIRRAFL